MCSNAREDTGLYGSCAEIYPETKKTCDPFREKNMLRQKALSVGVL